MKSVESYYILLSFGETKLEEFKDYICHAKPDMIELEALRGTGYAFFPSNIAPVLPGLVGDPIAEWASICRDEGVKVGIYVAAWACGDPQPKAGWNEIDKNGNIKSAMHCYNSPWAEDFFIPFLLEIIDCYSPTHFWFDGVWLDNEPCYCIYCEKKFKNRYGYSIPKEVDVEKKYKIQLFREESMDEAIKHVSDELKKKSSEVKLACNTAYYFKALRRPVGVDWLSWDYLNTADWRNLSFQSTYLSTAGKPADIMVFENSRFWDKNNVYVRRPRSITHLKTEASSILAHGLIFHLWQDPNSDGTLGKYKKTVAKDIGEFVKERSDWCVGNESIAEIAILASRKEHLAYWGHTKPRDNPFFLKVLAMHQVLKEGHVPCEIVRDDTFIERKEQYKLVLLPETTILHKKTLENLKLFASSGGKILIIGEPENKKKDYLGLVSKEILQSKNMKEEVKEIEGNIFLLKSNTLSEFNTAPRKKTRNKILKAVEEILEKRLQLKTLAPPGVEVVMNKLNNDVYIHFVNHVPSKIFHEVKERYFDEIITLNNIQTKVKSDNIPQSIILMPSNKNIDFRYKDGYISFILPTLKHHIAAKIQF
jgi:hypothetical protein